MLRIRKMTRPDLALALGWAAGEGWNPGLTDSESFYAADPDGFFMGEIDGQPVGSLNAIAYDGAFGFLGLYIVRPEWRGKGHGMALWRHGMAYLGRRNVGLDGVVAQQENYKKSGFQLAYANIRYGGTVAGSAKPSADVVALDKVPFASIEADDATVFPAARSAFLRAWMNTRGHIGRALLRDGRLAAWGVIRPCRTGYKIGPLVADDRAAADDVVQALLGSAGAGEVLLDVPAVNPAAIALAEQLGLKPVFETARMYTGPIAPLRLDRVFGVTSFELG